MLDISLYHSIVNRYHHLRALRTVKMMNVISHQIEQQIIQYQMPVEFYAGFQRFSYFYPQIERYKRLASVCRHIYVFGVADVQPPTIAGIEFIELSSEVSLAHEWFLLIDAPEFWTLLSTREVSHDKGAAQRQFDGLWTFDAPIVESASQCLREALGQTYRPTQERYATLQNQNVSEATERLLQRLESN